MDDAAEKARKRARAYYWNHLEERRAYYQENKERTREYYQRSKDRIRAYYVANKVHIREQQKLYYDKRKRAELDSE